MQGEFRFPWLPDTWNVEESDRSFPGIRLVRTPWTVIIEEDIDMTGYDVFVRNGNITNDVTMLTHVSLSEALCEARLVVEEIESGVTQWQ